MDNGNGRNVNSFRFEDLRVYKKALNYSQWVSKNLKIAKTPTQVKLAQDFYKTTVNIPLNIAEGSSKTPKQFEQYLRFAKTSIRECVVYTSLALKSNLFSETTHSESRQTLIELIKMVCAMISSLQKNQIKKASYSYINEGDSENESEAEVVMEPDLSIQME